MNKDIDAAIEALGNIEEYIYDCETMCPEISKDVDKIRKALHQMRDAQSVGVDTGDCGRKLFELWVSDGDLECPSIERYADGSYKLMQIYTYWIAWQAAWKEQSGHLQSRIPEGWQLVPIEPTQEMTGMLVEPSGDRTDVVRMYQAMLSAAPRPGQADPVSKDDFDMNKFVDENPRLFRDAEAFKALWVELNLQPRVEGFTANNGEAYEIRGDIYWYVGVDPTDPKAHVFACKDYVYESWQASLTDEHCKRMPEHDLQPRACKENTEGE